MKAFRKIFFRIAVALLPAICLVSCYTSKSISFTEAGNGKPPDVIKLTNNTEYRVYDFTVRSKISGDTLILFDRTSLKPYAFIPESSIREMNGSVKVRKGSALYYTLLIVPLLFILK